jgi:hypothetical protein
VFKRRRARRSAQPLGSTKMNLYDIMGPVAVPFGVGSLFGAGGERGPAFWTAVVVGALAGCIVFIVLRRAMLRVPASVERRLAVYYIATPVAVLAATMGMAWVVRAGLAS